MSTYVPAIGLEIHAELKTRTKMFCDSLNAPDERAPNTNVCPVCMGHPGTLPTINKTAIEHVIRVGYALGGKVNKVTKFDRKNYFYPDLPKAYQISQSGAPIVTGGSVTLPSGTTVKIDHVHLEEDAGKLLHADDGKSTLVDYNRASVPLMELVTEPDIHSAADAVAFMKELQLLLRYLGVSDADLERGQMRADVNVSLSKDPKKLGTRAEVKNMNSFASVASAITYEIGRQTEILDKGGAVHQETRGWDDVKQRSTSQRSKEEAHDYRYFPEPDLPPIDTTAAFDLEAIKNSIPELPRAKQMRFMSEFGLTEKQAASLVETKELAEYYEEAYSELATRDELTTARLEKRPAELLYNYLTSDLTGLMKEFGVSFGDLRTDPNELAALVDMISDGRIMSRQAKDILRKMVETGESAEVILTQEDLLTISGETELGQIVSDVIAENLQAVADYRAGKDASMQFLIGQAMRKLRGRADPEHLKRLLKENL